MADAATVIKQALIEHFPWTSDAGGMSCSCDEWHDYELVTDMDASIRRWVEHVWDAALRDRIAN